MELDSMAEFELAIFFYLGIEAHEENWMCSLLPPGMHSSSMGTQSLCA